MVFQEVIQVLRYIKYHSYHNEDPQRKHKCAEVFPDDKPVDGFNISAYKLLHL